MGKNSRKRREARRPPRRPEPRPTPGAGFPFGHDDVDRSSEVIAQRVVGELHRLATGRLRLDLTDRADELVRRFVPLPASAVRRVVDEVVGTVVDARVSSGWCPDDLDQLLRRDGAPGDRALLARWLSDDLRRSSPEEPWREQVERFGHGDPLPPGEVDRIASALHLGALLQAQPGLPTTIDRRTRSSWSTRRTPTRPGTAEPASAADVTRKLATVRGLLAKAESTTYDEEAEALSAKAQELITRYALERLLEAETSGGTAGPGPGARRLWLEAPYVGAKAQLVHVVARANGCRAVLSDPPGVSTVVGTDPDLDAVELLVPSLLVQAGAAMLRHGKAVDARGTSRTRSFRQSFLMAFAVRIGERLTETAEQVLHDSGHEATLLPVLRSRDEAVQAAFDALVPRIRTTRASISNAAGWHAGQAAADLASLDVRRPLAEGDERAG